MAENAKMEWDSFEDESFMSQRVHHVKGLRAGTNTKHHGVMIFSKKVKPERWSDRKVTQHTVAINMDEYGECVYEKTLPVGTHLRDAKLYAEARMKEFISEGHKIIAD